jgi:hypothetical protein
MFGVGKIISGGTLVNNAATQIPNCILHLRADLGLTLNGSGQVTRWEDQSGRGNHAIVALNSNGPTISQKALNGKNVLTFASASTNALQIPAGGNNDLTTGATNNGLSVFAVWNWTGTQGAGFQCIINAAPSGAWSNNWGLGNGPAGSSGQLEFWESFYNTVGPPSSFSGITVANNNYRCSVGTYNFSNSIHLYNDGTDNSVSGQITFSRSAAPVIIGAYTSVVATTTAGYLDGNIAEIAVYNGDIGAINAEILHQYSVRNYGTP